MTEASDQELTIVNEIIRPLFILSKRSDGIIVEVTMDQGSFTIEECKEVVAAMKEITGGIPHKLLFIPGKHITLDKEGRTYMATSEALENVAAMAVIQTSITVRVIGNLYLLVDKPLKPTKFFENTDDAIIWLKKQH